MQETKILSLEDYRTGETALSEYRDLLNIDDLSKIFQVHKNTIYKHFLKNKQNIRTLT